MTWWWIWTFSFHRTFIVVARSFVQLFTLIPSRGSTDDQLKCGWQEKRQIITFIASNSQFQKCPTTTQFHDESRVIVFMWSDGLSTLVTFYCRPFLKQLSTAFLSPNLDKINKHYSSSKELLPPMDSNRSSGGGRQSVIRGVWTVNFSDKIENYP